METLPPTDRPLRVDLVNVALATAVIILVIESFRFLTLIREVVILLVVAIILATAIEPLVVRLRRLGLRRGQGVLVIYLAIALVVALFLFFLIQTAVTQVSALLEALPGLVAKLQTLAVTTLPYGPLQEAVWPMLNSPELTTLNPGQLAGTLTTGTLSGLIFATLGLFEAVFVVISIFVIAYFWIAERLIIRRVVLRLVKPPHRNQALTIWNDVEDKLGAWMRGQIVLMIIIGLLMGVGYGIMGVRFALLLGIIAGITEAIPIVGPYIGAIPAVLIALTQDVRLALVVAGYTFVVQFLEGNVLVPRIMEHSVGLTPLSVIMALLIGTATYGIVGALLAIPIAAAIQVALIDLIEPVTSTAPAEVTETPTPTPPHRAA